MAPPKPSPIGRVKRRGVQENITQSPTRADTACRVPTICDVAPTVGAGASRPVTADTPAAVPALKPATRMFVSTV